MSKAVAVKGDTQFATSTAKLSADTNSSGAWKLGELKIVYGDTISVDGKKVELSAEMRWTYEGGSFNTPSGTTQVPAVEEVIRLIAKPTILKDVNRNILVDGDKVSGAIDGENTIFVTKSQERLKTD